MTYDFLADSPVDQYLDYYQARLEGTQLFGDAWPKWFPFFGAGVVAAFLGAELFCAPEELTIWFKPRSGLDTLDTDLGGNMDIIASLHDTQILLMELIDRPQEIETARHQIAEFWWKYFADLNKITGRNRRGQTPRSALKSSESPCCSRPSSMRRTRLGS